MIIDIALFEFRRLFSTPLAWFILAITQFLLTLLFFLMLSTYLEQPASFQGKGITETVVAGYYRNSGIVFILLVPFLTMRTISEDFRSGTIQLLFSSPVSLLDLILGKYLAMVLFLLLMLLLISMPPASLALGTSLDAGHFFSCMVGLGLLMVTLSALGLFISCLFRYPPLAAVVTFAVIVMLWTAHGAVTGGSGLIYGLFNYLSLNRHFTTFTEGLFSTTDFFFFIICSVTFLCLGIWRLDSIRSYHW